MHKALHTCWKQVCYERGAATALTDTRTGAVLSFTELNDRAEAWLAEHPVLATEVGAVWCVTQLQATEWMTVCLAAIKAGAVLLPVESQHGGSSVSVLAREQGASYLIDATGVQAMAAGVPRPGIFLIKLTSGSTGEPTVLPFTAAEMMADGCQIMQTMSITSADRNYAVIPLGHSYGLGNLVMPFYLRGVSIVFGSSPFPQAMAEEIERYECTVLPLVPPLVKALSSVEMEDDALRSVRLVLSAGSLLRATHATRFHERTGKRVHNFYGSSETGGICFDRDGRFTGVDGVVGEPLEGVSLSVNADQSIQVRSSALCHAVYPSGGCSLQDRGELSASGVLHLHGRLDDVIKIAGRRVSLVEIESAFHALDGVSDVYVSCREGRSGELRCIVLYSGTASIDSVRAALLATLPEWKVPKFIRKVDAVTYTARGKKDRTALEAQVDLLFGS